ncbi:MAG: ribonuclease HIII [Mycoplasmoidaceae bacterium]
MSSSFSKKIDKKQIDLILKYMSSHLKENNNENILYFFSTKKYKMTIYKTSTLLIQGSDYDNILKMLNIKNENNRSNDHANREITIGTDESGNGDLFGGVSFAAVKIPKENRDKLIEIGVDDSKKLTDSFMKKVYPQVLNLTINEIYDIEPKKYNELYKKYENVNTIKTLGHNKVIKKIYQENDVVVIDQYTNLNRFNEQMKIINEKLNYEMHLETKAESKYLEVACASILARVSFLKQIEKIEKDLTIKIPLGSVTSVVKPCLLFLKENNVVLNKYIKEHFKTNKE